MWPTFSSIATRKTSSLNYCPASTWPFSSPQDLVSLASSSELELSVIAQVILKFFSGQFLRRYLLETPLCSPVVRQSELWEKHAQFINWGESDQMGAETWIDLTVLLFRSRLWSNEIARAHMNSVLVDEITAT